MVDKGRIIRILSPRIEVNDKNIILCSECVTADPPPDRLVVAFGGVLLARCYYYYCQCRRVLLYTILLLLLLYIPSGKKTTTPNFPLGPNDKDDVIKINARDRTAIRLLSGHCCTAELSSNTFYCR